MFENYVVLIKSNLNGLLRLIRADEYTISDGEILGLLDPEAFNPDDLREMYEDLTPSEDFEIEPLNYSGDDFNAACEVAFQTHPGGWGKAANYDGYVFYNGAYPFRAGGKWYSIYFYWEEMLGI